jgi:hypothetical protein
MMNQQLAPNILASHHVPLIPIGPQTDNLANDPFTRNLDRSKFPSCRLRSQPAVHSGRQPRECRRRSPAYKISPIKDHWFDYSHKCERSAVAKNA